MVELLKRLVNSFYTNNVSKLFTDDGVLIPECIGHKAGAVGRGVLDAARAGQLPRARRARTLVPAGASALPET